MDSSVIGEFSVRNFNGKYPFWQLSSTAHPQQAVAALKSNQNKQEKFQQKAKDHLLHHRALLPCENLERKFIIFYIDQKNFIGPLSQQLLQFSRIAGHIFAVMRQFHFKQFFRSTAAHSFGSLDCRGSGYPSESYVHKRRSSFAT